MCKNDLLIKMSDDSWNETSLLEQYQIFKYNYFIDIRPIFLNYLKKLYILYKKDLRFDCISKPFRQEKLKTENISKEIQIIKTDLLKSPFFRQRIAQMTQIVFQNYQEDSYKLPFFVLEENRRLHKKIKMKNYTTLFVELSDYVFHYFLNTHFSISTLDKMIRSLKIENSCNLHDLPCLVAAYFQLILHEQSSH